MAALNFEVEYNNRARVPEHPQIQERWMKASEALRNSAKCELDKPYGRGERQKYDIFHSKSGPTGPLAVFIHGGYWQRGDRKGHSFVARELIAQGVSVALPSYTLCPAASVMDIVGEMRQFLKTLYEATKRRPVVTGNSAGGHLTGALLATDWSKVGGVPADLVKAAYAISGVYDLAPAFSLTIALAEDGLTAQGTGQPAIHLMYQGVNDGHPRFFMTQVNAEIEFVPDAKSAMTSLVLHQGGKNKPAARRSSAKVREWRDGLSLTRGVLRGAAETPGTFPHQPIACLNSMVLGLD